MKRFKIISPIALLLVIGLILFIVRPQTDPNAPRYVPFTNQPVGPFGTELYDRGGAIPFQNGRVWILDGLEPHQSP